MISSIEHHSTEPERNLDGSDRSSSLNHGSRSDIILKAIKRFRQHDLPIDLDEQPTMKIIFPNKETIATDITKVIEKELVSCNLLDCMMDQALLDNMSLDEYTKLVLETAEKHDVLIDRVYKIVDMIMGEYYELHQTLIMPKHGDTESVFSNVLGYLAALFIRRTAEATKCTQQELALSAGMKSERDLHKWLHTVGLSAIDTSREDDYCALNIHEAIDAIVSALSVPHRSENEQISESRKIG